MQWTPTRSAALQHLSDFAPHAGRRYADTRNHDNGPGRTHVSQLSPWLHAGLLSEHEVLAATLDAHSASSAEKFISEVFWRVYFKGYLEQRPSVWRSFTEGRDAALAAIDSNAGLRTAYEQATEGRTGIAAFDSWARELAETGYLHNHARMWFASIWIFTLRIDWHLGADFFLRHLMDGDAASNTLSWRWVAGLHTKGKTYLARSGNIARYTANHPEGPLEAEGLADEAEALTEAEEHGRQPLDLPDPATPEAPYALLLHDEAASHVPLDLTTPPALVIAAARPDARSPLPCGDHSRQFAQQAVANGASEAGETFGCDVAEWTHDTPLQSLLAERGGITLACPYLPTGWTRDALQGELDSLPDSITLLPLLGDLDRAAWPHAKAGFFGVKKQIAAVMGEVGLPG